jgi:hypothetical protein
MSTIIMDSFLLLYFVPVARGSGVSVMLGVPWRSPLSATSCGSHGGACGSGDSEAKCHRMGGVLGGSPRRGWEIHHLLNLVIIC